MGHVAHPKSNCIPSSNDALCQRTKFKDLLNSKKKIFLKSSGEEDSLNSSISLGIKGTDLF